MDSICWGMLIAWLGADALGHFGTAKSSAIDDTEAHRQAVLRTNAWYAVCESWILPISLFMKSRFAAFVDRLDRDSAVLLSTDWTASDRLAVWGMQGITIATVIVWFSMMVGSHLSSSTPCFFVFVVSITVFVQYSSFNSEVQAARRQIRARLPMALEMMALIMESGGGDIVSSWTSVAAENRGHPLGMHLQLVLDQLRRGLGFLDALQHWSDRSQEDDISEVVLMLRTARQRGIPIQESLRILANQARLRRIQRLERAAESAKVHATWPGFIMMMACLLIACAPLTLTLWRIFYPK